MIIELKEFKKGCAAYQKAQPRDAIYNTATSLVEQHWGDWSKVADGLGVLLLVWNAAFYKFGSFDFYTLEDCLQNNEASLQVFRKRSLLSYSSKDDSAIKNLFEEMLDALQISEKKKKGTKTPVGVAKAIHLLAPDFFPLWDNLIAMAYECDYSADAAEAYLVFLKKTKEIAEELNPHVKVENKTLVKLIDEYNYSVRWR